MEKYDTIESPEIKNSYLVTRGKRISQIWSGILLFHYPSSPVALRGIVGFLEEVRESLFSTQMTADRVTTFQKSEKWKMHQDAESSEGGILKSLPSHKMLITNLCTQGDLGPERNAWAISLVGCRVLIFHSVDCYYLWKLPPTGKYSWKQVKRCQEAVSLFSKNHVIFFFFFRWIFMKLFLIIWVIFPESAHNLQPYNISQCFYFFKAGWEAWHLRP